MSEIKVNKITPRSGTNVQLGDSGDTITIPSGATFAGTQNISNSALTGSGQITTITITATNATSFAVQSGSLPTGLSLNTGSGSATITGTVSSGISSDTLFSFTIRATDAEGQTADRAFTINVTVGANNSGQFN
jgi:hypothetical protein